LTENNLTDFLSDYKL